MVNCTSSLGASKVQFPWGDAAVVKPLVVNVGA